MLRCICVGLQVLHIAQIRDTRVRVTGQLQDFQGCISVLPDGGYPRCRLQLLSTLQSYEAFTVSTVANHILM